MFRRRSALVPMLVAALLLPPAAAAAEPSVVVTADLAGKAIGLVEVSAYHCHDFDFPRLHCFQTAAELSAALQPALGLLGLTATSYVHVFEHSSYSGASMVVSHHYSVLTTISL